MDRLRTFNPQSIPAKYSFPVRAVSPQLRSSTRAETPGLSSRPLDHVRSFDHMNNSPVADSTTSLMGHNFGQVRVNDGAGARHEKTEKKLRAGINQNKSDKRGETVKGISASGSGLVSVDYAPEPTDTSSKIVFIQVMREYLDDIPAKPSESDANFAFQDADTTADFYHVDYEDGEADPYYNGDDKSDPGTQGNAISTPKINANILDDPLYDEANFPAGKSKLKYEFRSIAFSAAGADKGRFYGYAKWFYEKEKGKPSATKLDGTSTDTALPKSKEAIKLFCSNHGFVLPT